MVKKKIKVIVKKTKKEVDKKLEMELKKLGNTNNIFIESEGTPDDFKDYPLIVICKTNPKDYVYPVLIKLENNNIVRLSCMNNYISTVLRVIDLFKWSLDVRLQRKRQMKHIESGKILIVNEYILEKIPACRG